MRARWCGGVVLLLALSAVAEPNPDLEKAKKSLDELNYKQASTALDAAWKRPGNDREQVLKILELQGIIAATLNQNAKAAAAFQALLSLDPDHKLGGDNPPRVMTPYYEARGYVADKGGLEAKAAKAALANGRVIQVAVDVTDATRLAKKVRFHLKDDQGVWTDNEVALTSKSAASTTDAKHLEWWAELLNEYGGVLALVGSAEQPIAEGQAPEVAVAPLPPPPAPPVEEAHASAPWPAGRWAGVAVFGGGVAAAAVGVVEGLQANSLRDQVAKAAQDANHHVTGMTQAQAYQLDSQQRTAALVANICLVGAGVLAAGGVTLFVVNGPADTRVSLVPAGAGAVLSGSF